MDELHAITEQIIDGIAGWVKNTFLDLRSKEDFAKIQLKKTLIFLTITNINRLFEHSAVVQESA